MGRGCWGSPKGEIGVLGVFRGCWGSLSSRLFLEELAWPSCRCSFSAFGGTLGDRVWVMGVVLGPGERFGTSPSATQWAGVMALPSAGHLEVPRMVGMESWGSSGWWEGGAGSLQWVLGVPRRKGKGFWGSQEVEKEVLAVLRGFWGSQEWGNGVGGLQKVVRGVLRVFRGC